MTADEINRSFPNIADWIQGSGSANLQTPSHFPSCRMTGVNTTQ